MVQLAIKFSCFPKNIKEAKEIRETVTLRMSLMDRYFGHEKLRNLAEKVEIIFFIFSIKYHCSFVSINACCEKKWL